MEKILNLVLKQLYKHQKNFTTKENFQISRLIFLDKFLVNENELKIKLILFILNDIKNYYEKKYKSTNKTAYIKDTINFIENFHLYSKTEISELFNIIYNHQPNWKRVNTHATRRKIQRDKGLYVLEKVLSQLKNSDSTQIHFYLYSIVKYYILDYGVQTDYRHKYTSNISFRYSKLILFFENKLFLLKPKIESDNTDDYKLYYFSKSYSNKDRDTVIKRAKKIATRTKYIFFDFPFYNFQYLNKAIFLDKDKFLDKNLFEEINSKFVYYCWFVNICLFKDYGDDLQEFKLDCYLRNEIEEYFELLNNEESLYFKKELFYLDLIYYILTNTKYKLTTKFIDNSEWEYVDLKDKSKIWHVLFFPINLKIPIHKDHC